MIFFQINMKVLLAFIVTALMSQTNNCLESLLQDKGQSRPSRQLGIKWPAHLQELKFQYCLGTKLMGTAAVWCVPAAKPPNCLSGSWQKLASDPILGRCWLPSFHWPKINYWNMLWTSFILIVHVLTNFK